MKKGDPPCVEGIASGYSALPGATEDILYAKLDIKATSTHENDFSKIASEKDEK